MATWTETAPPASGATADRAYILCATPRSGTTLLCGMLADAGAGWPASYYRPQSIADWAEALGVTPDDDQTAFHRAYLAAIRRAGTAGGPICGLRLMWENAGLLFGVLERLFPGRASDLDRVEAALGPTRFIHLTRQDKLAQAISYHRAWRSGLWHRTADGSALEQDPPFGPEIYDADAIADQVERLVAEDAAWTRWFADEGIAPIAVTYEALAEDPVAVLATILEGLGLDPARAAEVAPATSRLADARTEAWAARFRAERTGLT